MIPTWLAVGSASLSAAAPPTPEQVAGLARVEAVALSPDGTALAYTLTTRTPPADDDEDAEWTVETQLWLVRGLDGDDPGAPRQLTYGADVSDPAFAPDNSAIAFLREVGDGDDAAHRLQVLPLDGGEARVVDTGDHEPAAFAWAPDGRSFAFTAAAPETEAERREAAQNGDVERAGDFPPHHLFTVPAGGGVPSRIGAFDRHVSALAYAPDGSRLAVVTSVSSDPYEEMLRGTVGVVTLPDGALHDLGGEPGAWGPPVFSPDGTRVAWLATRDTLTLRNVIAVAAADGSGRIDAARGLDGTWEAVAWAGADALVALAADKTRTAVFRIAADGSRSERLAGVDGRTVLTGLAAAADGSRFATIAAAPDAPGAPAWFDPAGGSGIAAQPADVSDWALGPVEVFRWKGPGGAALEGVLTLPPGASGPVPLMVYPHGGPDGVSQDGFDAWARYFAGRGFAVFRPNYRGSIGYGWATYASNRGRLGTIEHGDIEAGVDALIRAGRVRRDQLVYGGWSWGGYLTAWAIGHTDRYRAAVAGAAVVDVVSQYALSDVNHGAAAAWEYRGDPWTAPKRFARSNPMLSLHRATTPTLVLHGKDDVRVDASASRILYRALADAGCEVELFLYPGEPHGLRDPRHVAHALRTWGDWYDHHLGRTAPAPAEAPDGPVSSGR